MSDKTLREKIYQIIKKYRLNNSYGDYDLALDEIMPLITQEKLAMLERLQREYEIIEEDRDIRRFILRERKNMENE